MESEDDEPIGVAREVCDDGTVLVDLNEHGLETVIHRRPELFTNP